MINRICNGSDSIIDSVSRYICRWQVKRTQSIAGRVTIGLNWTPHISVSALEVKEEGSPHTWGH